MQKSLDLRQKKVIDVDTAEQIGYIRDMDIDLSSGKILSVTVPRSGFFQIFRDFKGVTVSWDEVLAIGSEYVLVKFKKNNKIADKC
ncbi:MAG: YlmC/YmxH family sporulation protein [Clostridia bacterium]|nr:YlmC/YmxH family sporulation protein [Clostridia bacterium]